MRRQPAILLLAGIAACAHARRSDTLPFPALASSDSGPFDPRTAGVFTLLSIELPEAGSTIGGHYAGTQFRREVDNYQLSEGTRAAWAAGAREAGDSVMRARGFAVRTPVLNILGDAEPMRGVRFGVYGDVVHLALNANGNVEPYVVDGAARVNWVLLDFVTGDVLYEDSSSGAIHGADSLGAAAARAVASALGALLDQPAFQSAVKTPRAVLELGDFAHPFPRETDTVRLGRRSQNMSLGSGIVGGVLMLTGLHGFTTSGILLSLDGYAIASSVVARQRWLWAVDFEQQRHAARVVRVADDVALLELSCANCSTVAWSDRRAFQPRERVVWIGAQHVLDDRVIGVAHDWRRLKAHSDHGSLTWRLTGRHAVEGAAVAGEDGIVSGIVAQGRVVPFSEAVPALRVSVPIDH